MFPERWIELKNLTFPRNLEENYRMKQALLFERLQKTKNAVRCTACARKCVIADGKSGFCGVRANIGGELFLTPYDKAIGCHLDPIEKKPLYHFLPGTPVFSFGTYGCNFGCLFCQNSDMSHTPRELHADDYHLLLGDIADKTPEKIVNFCVQNDIPSIAYTYNEPTIFAEYFLDTAILAKKHGIRNILVSNGFFSEELLEKMKGVIDGINIDLKGFSDGFYRKNCQARLSPKAAPDLSSFPKKYQKYKELGRILKNIELTHKSGIWLEVTTLVILGENDSDRILRNIAEFLVFVSPDIPWHISAFHPAFKMLDIPATPKELLQKAYEAGKKSGLHFVYTGNITHGKENTECPECGKTLITRHHYFIMENLIIDGKCPHCQHSLSGIWK